MKTRTVKNRKRPKKKGKQKSQVFNLQDRVKKLSKMQTKIARELFTEVLYDRHNYGHGRIGELWDLGASMAIVLLYKDHEKRAFQDGFDTVVSLLLDIIGTKNPRAEAKKMIKESS